MIRYITGPLGSGKTVLAMCFAVKNFCTDSNLALSLPKRFLLKDKKRFVSNVNGLNKDMFTSCIYKSQKDLVEIIKELHKDYIEKDLDDEQLIDICEDLEISHSLLIIDECQNILGKSSESLVWFLTYCRHMYIDVILITQSLGLIKSEYKPLSDTYFKAFSSKLRFSQLKFRYALYLDSKMTSNGRTVFSVKVPKDFFVTYGSGNVLEEKSMLFRYISIAIVKI